MDRRGTSMISAKGFDMATVHPQSSLQHKDAGARRPRHRCAASRLVALPLIASLVAGPLATGSLAAGSLAALSLLVAPSRASAQTPAAPPTDPTAIQRADAAFEEGRAFHDQGRFKEACEKFELSMQLDPSPGTLLNLGNCYEPQGDLVRALETFERAFIDAQRAGDPRRKELWTEAARERIANLSRRVPQLKVRGVPADGRVSIDRRPTEHSGALRINPGRHTIEVGAPGKRAFTREFDIASGQRLAINVPPLEPDLTPAAAPTVAPSEPVPAAERERGMRYGPFPYVLGSAGAVLLATSLATGLSANAKQNELEKACPDYECRDASLKSTKDSAQTLALLTDVFWITGVLVAGVGVTLFVLDASADEEDGAVQAGCFESGCGVRASGHF
jgi:tetratricopeptide (TPR) repeat protein